MAGQALYLKYRPQTFDAVAGQAHVTQTLRNALIQGRLRHAYLFCGPRGTGKTTTARLLAKAVNCLAPEAQRPCNACSLCTAINEGRLLDLIEIDAASNRGIDEIRDLREKVGFRPNQARFKVYVLDEAHMLTDPAFNALLKTLEEPPPHVIFTLVTTDPQKIPATITSRCQRFDFRRIGLEDMVDRLRYIAAQENLKVEPEALQLIAHHSTGGMRDAISLLDQMTSYGDEITLAQVQTVLGTIGGEAANKLVACLVAADVAGGLDVINRNVAEGADPRQFAREVVEYLRGLLLIHEGAGTRLLNVTAEQATEMEAAAARLTLDHLLRVIKLFNDAATELKRGFQTLPQLPLEMAFVESVHSASSGEPTRSGRVPQPAPTRPPSPAAQPDEPPARHTALEPGPTGPAARQAEAPATRAAEPAPAVPAEAQPVAPEPQPPAAGSLAIADVTDKWDQILAAVRRRNRTSEASLRSGCKAVEVNGNQVVITHPPGFVSEKLSEPQRRMEIQEALSEIVGTMCSVKLVLETEYTPSRAVKETAPPYRPGGETAAQPPAATAGASPTQQSGGDAGPDPSEIDRYKLWAKQRGGHVVP